MKRAFLLVLAMCVSSACTTVSSSKVDNFSASSEATGFTYFLPTKPIRFTATRSPSTDAELQKLKGERESILRGATEALKIAEVTLENAESVLAAATANGTQGNALTQLQTAKDLAQSNRDVASDKKDEAQAKLDDVMAQIAGTVARKGCQFTAKIELMAAQADPRYRLVARMNHSGFRDDLQTFSVSSAGLLQSADVTATDRTGDILVEAASLAGRLSTFRPALAAPDQAADAQCEKANFVDIIDPLQGVSWDGTNVKFPEVERLNMQLSLSGFPYWLRISAPSLTYSNATVSRAYRFDSEDVIGTGSAALYYRTPAPVTLSVIFGGPQGAPIASTVANLPQAGPISSIPMRSSAFVKSQDTLAFEDGMLTSWTKDRPSEFAAAVALPGRMIGGLVGGVVQGVTDNGEIRNAQATDYQSELALQRAKLERDLILLCVAEAQDSEDGDPLACFPEAATPTESAEEDDKASD